MATIPSVIEIRKTLNFAKGDKRSQSADIKMALRLARNLGDSNED
ncbi:MAG: hypothetical protein PHQ24_10080 [Proteiniphilum sp.]|nr:hypothetical protein [Proteiniphilum sp.]